MKEIIERLEKLKKIDVDSLERKGKDYNLSDIFVVIKKTYNSFMSLEHSSDFWEELPNDNRQLIISHLERFLEITNAISTFDVNRPDASNNWAQLKPTINKSLFESYSFVRDYDVYLARKALQKKDIEANLKKLSDSVIEAESIKQKLDEILKSSMDASGKQGLTEYAEIFKTQSEENKKTAETWLKYSIASFFVLFAILAWIFIELISSISKSGIATLSFESIFTRVLLISFASILIYQFLKNYNANMHQYSLNKHRENCLRTFRTFINATDDEKVRDAVLIQATKTIFESGETGFVSHKEGTGSVFEITNLLDRSSKE